MVKPRLIAFTLTLLAIGLVTLLPLRRAESAPQKRGKKTAPRCTPQALAALIPIPELAYECEASADDNLKSEARREAMDEYQQGLEATFAEPGWWATPAGDLNLCAITNEARALNDDERRELEYKVGIYGDATTRLVVVVDPCVWYSSNTLNAYILERAGNRVYATQVLDAYYTRIDKAVAMTLARQGGERLVMVETHTSDGMMPPTLFTTYSLYAISPRSHRAVPKKIFLEGGKLTHQFRQEDYLFGDGPGDAPASLADRWRPPEIIRNGRLAPRFTVYTPIKRRLAHDTYIWTGRYYQRQR